MVYHGYHHHKNKLHCEAILHFVLLSQGKMFYFAFANIICHYNIYHYLLRRFPATLTLVQQLVLLIEATISAF